MLNQEIVAFTKQLINNTDTLNDYLHLRDETVRNLSVVSTQLQTQILSYASTLSAIDTKITDKTTKLNSNLSQTISALDKKTLRHNRATLVHLKIERAAYQRILSKSEDVASLEAQLNSLKTQQKTTRTNKEKKRLEQQVKKISVQLHTTLTHSIKTNLEAIKLQEEKLQTLATKLLEVQREIRTTSSTSERKRLFQKSETFKSQIRPELNKLQWLWNTTLELAKLVNPEMGIKSTYDKYIIPPLQLINKDHLLPLAHLLHLSHVIENPVTFLAPIQQAANGVLALYTGTNEWKSANQAHRNKKLRRGLAAVHFGFAPILNLNAATESMAAADKVFGKTAVLAHLPTSIHAPWLLLAGHALPFGTAVLSLYMYYKGARAIREHRIAKKNLNSPHHFLNDRLIRCKNIKHDIKKIIVKKNKLNKEILNSNKLNKDKPNGALKYAEQYTRKMAGLNKRQRYLENKLKAKKTDALAIFLGAKTSPFTNESVNDLYNLHFQSPSNPKTSIVDQTSAINDDFNPEATAFYQKQYEILQQIERAKMKKSRTTAQATICLATGLGLADLAKFFHPALYLAGLFIGAAAATALYATAKTKIHARKKKQVRKKLTRYLNKDIQEETQATLTKLVNTLLTTQKSKLDTNTLSNEEKRFKKLAENLAGRIRKHQRPKSSKQSAPENLLKMERALYIKQAAKAYTDRYLQKYGEDRIMSAILRDTYKDTNNEQLQNLSPVHKQAAENQFVTKYTKLGSEFNYAHFFQPPSVEAKTTEPKQADSLKTNKNQ